MSFPQTKCDGNPSEERFRASRNDGLLLYEKFDREFDTTQRELDFVYFLDGSEGGKKALVKSARDLRMSYKRPKWDIVQK